jgi:hypothetical protein
MWRSKTHAAVALFFMLSQPSLALAAPVASPHSHQRVYLLRGFMNVFSLGMDQLAAELGQRNIEAVVGNHTLSSFYANEAIRDCKSGLISSIAIVGHSLGATAAVSMADQLSQAGVKVGLVVTVDPVTPSEAHGNVRLLKNFYISDGVGKTVERGQDFRGSLQNVDLKGNPSVGHVSLANSTRLHQEVLGYIKAAAGSRCR